MTGHDDKTAPSSDTPPNAGEEQTPKEEETPAEEQQDVEEAAESDEQGAEPRDDAPADEPEADAPDEESPEEADDEPDGFEEIVTPTTDDDEALTIDAELPVDDEDEDLDWQIEAAPELAGAGEAAPQAQDDGDAAKEPEGETEAETVEGESEDRESEDRESEDRESEDREREGREREGREREDRDSESKPEAAAETTPTETTPKAKGSKTKAREEGPITIEPRGKATQATAAKRDPTERPRRTHPRQVIALASGKGGVGKSVLAASIGIYLAQLGKQVLLVDANLGSGNVHTLVGNDDSAPSMQGFLSKELKLLADAVVTTPFDKLGIVSGHGDGMGTANPRPAQKNRLLSQLRALPCDYAIIDTAPGSGFNALDTFLAADMHVVVTQPEPPAIESAFRLIKSAFLRKIKNAKGLAKLLEAVAPVAHCGLPTPQQLHVAAQEAEDEELRKTLREAMSDFRPLLVVNKTRTREDLELGPALAVLGRRHLGLPMEYIGYVEHDDLVWVSVRRRRPLLVQFPEAKVCKDLERLARRILARDSPDRTFSDVLPVPLAEQNHYEILGIHPGALEAEVRAAARRVRRIYDSASPAIYGVAPPAEIDQVLLRVEDAYSTLVDPEKSQEYIRSIFPDWQGAAADEDKTGPTKTPAAAPPQVAPVREGILEQADVEPIPAAPMPHIDGDTAFSGELLKAVREARGLDLQDIADSTKISISHLRAIEEENFASTPAPVYLRGFIRAIAKHLKLDQKQVVSTYMDRHDAST